MSSKVLGAKFNRGMNRRTKTVLSRSGHVFCSLDFHHGEMVHCESILLGGFRPSRQAFSPTSLSLVRTPCHACLSFITSLMNWNQRGDLQSDRGDGNIGRGGPGGSSGGTDNKRAVIFTLHLRSFDLCLSVCLPALLPCCMHNTQ